MRGSIPYILSNAETNTAMWDNCSNLVVNNFAAPRKSSTRRYVFHYSESDFIKSISARYNLNYVLPSACFHHPTANPYSNVEMGYLVAAWNNC